MKNKILLPILLCSTILLLFTACSESKDDSNTKSEKESVFELSEYNEDNLFTNGLLAFRSDSSELMGYININGEYIIEPQYYSAYGFDADGLARVEADNGMYGLINTDGEYVIEPKYRNIYGSFDEYDMLYVGASEGGNGFIDREENWVIESKYISINEFADNGLACMRKPTDETYETFLYGYIDREGNEVIPAQYEEAESFASNGLAVVKKDSLYGYIDSTGKVVIDPIFQQAESFGENGLAYAQLSDDGVTGYIDATGEFSIIINEKDVYSCTAFNKYGIAIISVAGVRKIINEQGQIISDTNFNYIGEFDENGIAVFVQNDYEYGYINKDGEIIIEPVYDSAETFCNGYARVTVDDKIGYVDTNGNMIIEPQYDKATDFYADGYAIVALEYEEHEYKYAIIDTEGNYLIDFK